MGFKERTEDDTESITSEFTTSSSTTCGLPDRGFPDVEAGFGEEDTRSEGRGSKPATPHELYYFQDNMVEIRVEDIMFRIPRFYLTRQSQYFMDLFEQRDADGITAPLRLKRKKVKANAFAHLLQIIDPPNFRSITLTTIEEWSNVLDLADRWGFSDIKALAIGSLEPIASPIEKIMLGRRYIISDWLPGAYLDLCNRTTSLSIEEARSIPLEDVVMIAMLRDRTNALPVLSQDAKMAQISEALGRPFPTKKQPSSQEDYATDSPQAKEGVPSGEEDMVSIEAINDMLLELCNSAVDDEQALSRAKLFIQHKIKVAHTLQDLLHLTVIKGIELWKKDDLSSSQRCAALCASVADVIEPNFNSNSILNTAEAVAILLARVCRPLVDFASIDHAARDGRAMQQAGFLAQLYEMNLVPASFVEGWWSYIYWKYARRHIVAEDIDHVFAFLSSVGSAIDCTPWRPLVRSTLLLLGRQREYKSVDDWKASKDKVGTLEDMSERRWCMT